MYGPCSVQPCRGGLGGAGGGGNKRGRNGGGKRGGSGGGGGNRGGNGKNKSGRRGTKQPQQNNINMSKKIRSLLQNEGFSSSMRFLRSSGVPSSSLATRLDNEAKQEVLKACATAACIDEESGIDLIECMKEGMTHYMTLKDWVIILQSFSLCTPVSSATDFMATLVPLVFFQDKTGQDFFQHFSKLCIQELLTETSDFLDRVCLSSSSSSSSSRNYLSSSYNLTSHPPTLRKNSGLLVDLKAASMSNNDGGAGMNKNIGQFATDLGLSRGDTVMLTIYCPDNTPIHTATSGGNETPRATAEGLLPAGAEWCIEAVVVSVIAAMGTITVRIVQGLKGESPLLCRETLLSTTSPTAVSTVSAGAYGFGRPQRLLRLDKAPSRVTVNRQLDALRCFADPSSAEVNLVGGKASKGGAVTAGIRRVVVDTFQLPSNRRIGSYSGGGQRTLLPPVARKGEQQSGQSQSQQRAASGSVYGPGGGDSGSGYGGLGGGGGGKAPRPMTLSEATRACSRHLTTSSRPSSSVSVMNPSQHRAILHALSNEVSLVHGPPGTGKASRMAGCMGLSRGYKCWDGISPCC